MDSSDVCGAHTVSGIVGGSGICGDMEQADTDPLFQKLNHSNDSLVGWDTSVSWVYLLTCTLLGTHPRKSDPAGAEMRLKETWVGIVSILTKPLKCLWGFGLVSVLRETHSGQREASCCIHLGIHHPTFFGSHLLLWLWEGPKTLGSYIGPKAWELCLLSSCGV